MGQATEKRPRGAPAGRSPAQRAAPTVAGGLDGHTPDHRAPASSEPVSESVTESTTGSVNEAITEAVNEVTLRGRLAAAAEERELPSGDRIVTLRIVVPREGGPVRRKSADGARRRATVDTIDVVCWSALTRRAALRLRPDDQVAVEGALRRRFFGGSAGPQSRYEVEAVKVRRAAPRAGRGPGRSTPGRT